MGNECTPPAEARGVRNPEKEPPAKGSMIGRESEARDEIDGVELDEDDPPFYYDTYAEAEPDELL